MKDFYGIKARVISALEENGVRPEDTASMTDNEVLRLKFIGRKGLVFLRQEYPTRPQLEEILAAAERLQALLKEFAERSKNV